MREDNWITWFRAGFGKSSRWLGSCRVPLSKPSEKSIYCPTPLSFSAYRLPFLGMPWSQIDASSLLRHFVLLTKSQCFIPNRCDSASRYRFSFSVLRRVLFQSLAYRFIMFSSRSHYTETSFSKHRAIRAASKSKRSFQEHGSISTRRPRNKRPAGSPPTGMYVFVHFFHNKKTCKY